MKVLILLLLVVCSQTVESYESEYLGFSKNKPLFGLESDIIERFYYDDNSNLFTTGDGVGVIHEKRESEFICFTYEHIFIALPEQCEITTVPLTFLKQ